MSARERVGESGLSLTSGRRRLTIANGELVVATGRLMRSEIVLLRIELFDRDVELWASLKNGRELRVFTAPRERFDVAMLRAALADEDLRVDLFPALGPVRGAVVPGELEARAKLLLHGVPPGVTFVPARRRLHAGLGLIGLLATAAFRSALAIMVLSLFAWPIFGVGYWALDHLPERDIAVIGIAGSFFWLRLNWFLLKRLQRRIDEKRAREREGLYFFPDGCLLFRRRAPRVWVPRREARSLGISQSGSLRLVQLGSDGPREIDLSHFRRERWPELESSFARWQPRSPAIKAGGGPAGT